MVASNVANPKATISRTQIGSLSERQLTWILRTPPTSGRNTTDFLRQECARHACGGPAPIDCKYSSWNHWGDCDKCNGFLAMRIVMYCPQCLFWGGMRNLKNCTPAVGRAMPRYSLVKSSRHWNILSSRFLCRRSANDSEKRPVWVVCGYKAGCQDPPQDYHAWPKVPL